jgi:signal transduction histidine kinase
MLKTRLRFFFYCCFFLLAMPASHAQESKPGDYTDISTIRVSTPIIRTIYSSFRNFNESFDQAFPTLNFIPGLKFKATIPNHFVSKKIVIRFNLSNHGDEPDSVFLFPGFYYKDIRLYRQTAGQLPVALPVIYPHIHDSIGFRLITIAPHDSATFFADLTFVKTYNNTVRPRLVKPGYINLFLSDLQIAHYGTDLVTYILCGLLLMMLLFSISNFLQGANKEYFYYTLYALLMGVMLFSQAYLGFHTSQFAFYMEAYLDFIMQGLGIIFYMLFMQRFLETKKYHPFVYHLYNAGIVFTGAALCLYSWFHSFTNNFNAENMVETFTKFFWLILIVVFLVYSIKQWQNVLLRYIFWGNLCLFIFAVISQLTVLFYSSIKNLPGVFSSSIFYYEVGILLELVFFLAGLNHKNRRRLIAQTRERETLKAQNLLKEYEKELAVYKAQQAERERISADMHDELGSGMTAIRLMSEIARNKMKENTPVEIEKISSSADDVLNKMNAIIWSMNSGNDTLDNLISYIRAYALEYFESTPVQCRVITPEKIPDMELAGDKRRNIFLCIKETLNNALKHSQGTEITIDINVTNTLRIRITDNGKGIDTQQLRQFGNGLKNIRRRMENIGGTFSIENNNGTVTTLDLPL